MMAGARAYLDHNATSPLRFEAREAMTAAFDVMGNPSSIHAEGRAAQGLLEEARETIAGCFKVSPARVMFTSGATEAANWVLSPKVLSGTEKYSYLFYGQTEHVCIGAGHKFGPQSHLLEHDADGVVDLIVLAQALEAHHGHGKVMVSVQAANNETGVMQPLAQIVEICRTHDALLVSDAVQTIGRMSVENLKPSDVMFISAHKFGGPKGVGAVILNNGCLTLEPFITGGGQERRMRAGTENITGIIGMAAALKAAVAEQEVFAARASAWQQQVETDLRALASDAVIFGANAPRLANTTCFALPSLRAEMLLIALDLAGVSVSSGSACSSGKVETSHVLKAMGIAPGLAECAIRLSTGWNTTSADIDKFLTVLTKIYSGKLNARAA